MTANAGYGVNADEDATSADTLPVTGAGVPLDTNWLARAQAGGGNGLLLVEGRAATTQPLWLEIWRNGQKLGGVPLYLSLSGVEQMFRHYNLSGYGNGSIEVDNRFTAPNEPPTNGKNLVFLHGYNVNQQQARGVQSEMFKRFYWSGSKARFYGVTWNGSQTQVSSIGFTPDLETNVVNAFLTAPYLATFLNGLTGETTLVAHSLGNMVCLSAVSDWNANPSHYFMIDSAVAMEAVDGSVPANPDMVHPDWVSPENYETRLHASSWWQLFTNTDARSTLTWSNRLGNLGSVDIYNFYSSGEEVLRDFPGTPPNTLVSSIEDIVLEIVAGVDKASYAWVWQEKDKGRMSGNNFISSNHGGWGLNINYETVSFGGVLIPMTANQAALLTADQLRTNAFFNMSIDSSLFTTNSSGSTYAAANRDRILSDAIPALTLPAGANSVTNLDIRAAEKRNFNMQDEFETGWPSTRSIGDESLKWHHTDFDYVAYPFTYKLFGEILNDGNLK